MSQVQRAKSRGRQRIPIELSVSVSEEPVDVSAFLKLYIGVIMDEMRKSQPQPAQTPQEVAPPDPGVRYARLTVDLTRYHPALVVGYTGRIVGLGRASDRFANVVFPHGSREILWSSLEVVEAPQ